MTSVMISKLELKSEGFNPKVGSTYNFSGLNLSIEDSDLGTVEWPPNETPGMVGIDTGNGP